ncbi:MAG: outer membrane homotrimeric porin, partial [Desulfovibrio sp.]|nr:outer membrane homotrimeric porin [Desulfovibrio sp.]
TGASAIDFKAKGEWIIVFDYGQNGGFTGGNGRTGSGYGDGDEFEAGQRVRLQLDAVASENLSGQVFFEIGGHKWGIGATALGADSNSAIKLRRAFIDWMVPQTDLKIRMGLQGVGLPSFTTESMVFVDDVAGISASYKFDDNVSATALWLRPFNDNYSSSEYNGTRNSYMDNLDAFVLSVPLTFDGVKVTPWGMYAAIGPNTFRSNEILGTSSKYYRTGLLPVGGAQHKDGSSSTKNLESYGDAFWAGLTGEVTTFDPFRIAWDANYGSVSWQDNSRLNRSGWLASLLFEYKLDWSIPGLYGWYSSGDDNNPANGSERMPSISTNNANNQFSDFAMNGAPWWHSREGVLSNSMSGTWGIGARLKDVGFVEDLKHTLYLNYMGGTNSTTMAKYIKEDGGTPNNVIPNGISTPTRVGMDPLYMTTGDSALEIGLRNVYQMYENFQIYFEGAYIATWLDHSKKVWGNSNMNGVSGSDQVRDPWNINLSFVYSF